jgi:hypothetical protein
VRREGAAAEPCEEDNWRLRALYISLEDGGLVDERVATLGNAGWIMEREDALDGADGSDELSWGFDREPEAEDREGYGA